LAVLSSFQIVLRPLIRNVTHKDYVEYKEKGLYGDLKGKIAIFMITNDKTDQEYLKGTKQAILDEKLVTSQYGFGFRTNHFLFHLTDHVVQRLLATGIIQNMLENQNEICERYLYEDNSEPQVFHLEDVAFEFVVWIVPFGFCLLVFAAELTWFHNQRKLIQAVRNSIGLYFILERLGRGFGL
jgi:hypothetical protein